MTEFASDLRDLDEVTSAVLLLAGVAQRVRSRVGADRSVLVMADLFRVASAVASELDSTHLLPLAIEPATPERAAVHVEIARQLVYRAIADGRIGRGARGAA